jgi:hypothetical protein
MKHIVPLSQIPASNKFSGLKSNTGLKFLSVMMWYIMKRIDNFVSVSSITGPDVTKSVQWNLKWDELVGWWKLYELPIPFLAHYWTLPPPIQFRLRLWLFFERLATRNQMLISLGKWQSFWYVVIYSIFIYINALCDVAQLNKWPRIPEFRCGVVKSVIDNW